MVPKKRKVASPVTTPTKAAKAKDKVADASGSEADADEEEDIDETQQDDGIAMADLKKPPPARRCTLPATSTTASSPSSSRPPASKKQDVPLEYDVKSAATLQTIQLIVAKTYEMTRDVQTTLWALYDKTNRNTRSIVDLTQLTTKIEGLAEAATGPTPVKEEAPRGLFSAIPIDEKIVQKFCSNALSHITMWPKFDAPQWLKLKTQAFGADLANKPELDQVSNFCSLFFFYACLLILFVFFCRL